VADISYNCVPRTPNVGSDCTFSGSASSDPDGSIVSYTWTSANKQVKTGVSIVYPFPAGSRPSVTLTVTDNQGATGTKTITVIVP
jgi:large repetitive protein